MRFFPLLLALLAALSCAATTPGVRQSSGTPRGDVRLCKSVDVHKSGAIVTATQPIEPGDVFYASDWQAVAYVSLGERKRAHTMRFVWFDPSGERYLDSGPLTANATGTSHRYNEAWHTLRIWGEPSARRSGRWNVTVYLDGEPLSSRDFTLRSR